MRWGKLFHVKHFWGLSFRLKKIYAKIEARKKEAKKGADLFLNLKKGVKKRVDPFFGWKNVSRETFLGALIFYKENLCEN